MDIQGTASSSPTGPDARTVRRALWIAVAWAYVAALAAVLIVGITAVVALTVELVRSLSNDRSFSGATATNLAELVAWVLIPIALAVSVWAAAYGSTKRDSLQGAVVAVVAAALAGFILWRTRSLAILPVALGVGWSIAMPAEHPGRWMFRLLPAAAPLLVYGNWDTAAVWLITIAVVTGPVVGGISVIFGDAVWTLARRLRERGSGETVRSPTSLDV